MGYVKICQAVFHEAVGQGRFSIGSPYVSVIMSSISAVSFSRSALSAVTRSAATMISRSSEHLCRGVALFMKFDGPFADVAAQIVDTTVELAGFETKL